MRFKIKGCVWLLAIDGEMQWDKLYTSSLPALESAMDTIFENNLCGQETNRWLTAPKALPDILPNVYSWKVCTIEDERIAEMNVIQLRRITVVGNGCY